MKNLFKRGLALLIVLMIIVSSISISSFAAVSRPQANTGIRDQVCTTFNNTTAPSYYTGSYSYANLSALSSSSLKSALNTLMTSTHKNTSTYDNCRDYSPYTDCEGGDSSHFTMLYTSYSATYDQYNSGQGWNREHVWPQSLGGGNTNGGGADLHHIRPDESKTNSTRSNRRYGNVSNGTAATGNLSGAIGGYYGGNDLYEPLDNVKGDVARICLYVHVRWGSGWGASNITSVFESVDTLLEWCALDPVDTWEMERNDVIQGVQGNRNVFIDYPELAWMIFGKTVPSNLTSPSDGVENGTVGGGGNEGGDEGGSTPDVPTDPTPDTPVGESATITFATKENRVSLTTTSQVWSENGITFTNNKSGSSTAVADYVNPVRLYKGSEIIIESPDMTKIVIKCASSYVNGTKVGLENAGYTVSVDGVVVTLTLDSPVDSITYTASEQTRLNSIDVYYAAPSGGDEGGSAPDVPTDPTPDVPTDPTPEVPVDPTPNPGEDIGGGDEGGSTPGITGNITFELGENGSASHGDGSSATTYSETVDGYTLNVTSGVKFYKGARDAKGNSAFKLGTSSDVGSFKFTVPSEVNSVIIKVAQYKANATAVSINGTSYTITTASNNGEYTEITVDTTTNKTVTVATTSGGKRAMVNSITYVIPVLEGCESGKHNENEYGYCKDCEVAFRTASVMLSADLAMRYGVEVIDEALLGMGEIKMVFTFGGETYVVTDYVISGEYYVFVFDGISPDEMTIIITADLYIGDEIVATFSDYSVEKNLLSVREKNSTDTTLVQLINDVLVYGSASQKFTNNNTSDLAGDGADNVNASTGVPTDEVLIDGNSNKNLYIKSMGVHFDCVNYIYIKIYVSSPSVFGGLTVDDKIYTLADMQSLGDGVYRLNFDPVAPTSFDDLMLVTLFGADSVEYTNVIYSMNCYATHMYTVGAEEGSAMYELALALYRYGRSATAYAIAHA